MSLQLPLEPPVGEPVSPRLIAQLIRYVRAITPRQGEGTRLSYHPSGTTIAAARQRTARTGGALNVPEHPFKCGMLPIDPETDTQSVRITAGYVDGLACEASGDIVAVPEAWIYGVAQYATAYDALPNFCEIGSSLTLPKSHDTRWVFPIARISPAPATGQPPGLYVYQITTSSQNSFRRRSPRTFEVTREGDNLRVQGGAVYGLASSSGDVSVSVAPETLAASLGSVFTVVLTITATYTLFTAWESPAHTVTVVLETVAGETGSSGTGYYGTLESDFIPIPPQGTTTNPCAEDEREVLVPLSLSNPDPTAAFSIALATVDTTDLAGEWVITQKHLGDVGIPLHVNWAVPFKTPPTPAP